MITVKIDVTKVDKSKLYKGQKGTYLDVVLIETPNDTYGNDYMAVQGVNKLDRQKGIKGAILGNAKILQHTQSSSTAKPPVKREEPEQEEEPDALPF